MELLELLEVLEVTFMMRWLIMRGARFYDIMGILLLSLSVESLMNGISRLRNGYASLLCFVATVLWIIAGRLVLEVVHDLQVYEERCVQEDILDPEEVWNLIVNYQEHIQMTKKVVWAFVFSLLAISALIAANLLTKS
jgi:hypothetical protein